MAQPTLGYASSVEEADICLDIASFALSNLTSVPDYIIRVTLKVTLRSPMATIKLFNSNF